jgi:redox-sensitive bicupin YhaK (pirin superfamily)
MIKKLKSVEAIMYPPEYHMVGDGFRVHNFFPSQSIIGMTGMSPFFLLDYNSKWQVPPSYKPRGVGVHPHRGFETVTIAYHGSIAHHDSKGNSGIIHEGDVQWMTAGAGILHKEYHENEFSKSGGLFQMVQIWVNLPSSYKMTPAKYQALESEKMGIFTLPDEKGIIEVIAGDYNGIKGPATTFTPLHMYNARLKKEAIVSFSFPESYNTGILVIEGEARLHNAESILENQFIFFGHTGENINIEALENSTLLILSGEPINEPIVSYGPFVMSTEAEIKKAYDDYYNGEFGVLED